MAPTQREEGRQHPYGALLGGHRGNSATQMDVVRWRGKGVIWVEWWGGVLATNTQCPLLKPYPVLLELSPGVTLPPPPCFYLTF